MLSMLLLWSCGESGAGDDGALTDYCETCNLDEQVPMIAAEEAIDCGEVGVGEDPATVVACVEQALADGTAFTARQQLQGIDSAAITAYVVDSAGVVQRLGYDSNVCGGAECNEDCGPRVSIAECGNARVGMMPADAIIDCDLGSFSSLCEPPV